MIYDINTSDIRAIYGIVILASGYESRSSHSAELLVKMGIRAESVFVYSYNDVDDDRDVAIYDFAKRITEHLVIVRSASDLLSGLRGLQDKHLTCPHIFLDYSSMRRDIYSTIINFIRDGFISKAHIDLFYVNASYVGDFTPLSINDIYSIEGSRYISDPRRKNAVFLGLGFDKVSPVSVCELLEPDVIVPFLSSESPDQQNDLRAFETNKEFLSGIGISPVNLPISSLQRSYQIILETVAYYIGNHNCILVPMGPKPHVMSCVLLSAVWDGLSCIHVSGNREKNVDAIPIKDAYTITRIKPDPRAL